MMIRHWFAPPRAYLVLGAAVLFLRSMTALPIEHAGYMDASYTLHVAENLVLGRGFTEHVLWNYLDAPTGLPHPSNLYWMPLPAILAAASFAAFGISYHAAQIPFVLLSIFPPLFAFFLACRIFSQEGVGAGAWTGQAWTAGLLAAFSGFYTIYWIAPDNFAPFAVAVDLGLLLMTLGLERRGLTWHLWFASGIFAGLSQLSRADGFLVLFVAPIALLISRQSLRRIVRDSFSASLGFLLIISPWLARNYIAVGSLLPPGGARTLFLTGYDELFRYNTGDLTLGRYLDWGAGNILSSKLNALGFDLLVLLFGSLMIFLAPFAVIGIWGLRSRMEFRPFLIYLVLMTLAMALLFTFPGMRGSMLHSSAALVAYLAVAVPAGLDASISWIARRRRQWDERTARIFFRGGFVTLAGGLSIFLYAQGVFGVFATQPATIPLWNSRDAEYIQVSRQLDAWGVPTVQPVMTVDPPSFFNETGRRSIYLPTEGTSAIFQAARQFDSHYFLLEYDHPIPLNGLYGGSAQVIGLTSVASFQDAIGRPVVLFEIGN